MRSGVGLGKLQLRNRSSIWEPFRPSVVSPRTLDKASRCSGLNTGFISMKSFVIYRSMKLSRSKSDRLVYTLSFTGIAVVEVLENGVTFLVVNVRRIGPRKFIEDRFHGT